MDGRIVLQKTKDIMSCLRGPQSRGAEKRRILNGLAAV
jgi:hypothetical protein